MPTPQPAPRPLPAPPRGITGEEAQEQEYARAFRAQKASAQQPVTTADDVALGAANFSRLNRNAARAQALGQKRPTVQDAGAMGKDILKQATGKVPLEQGADETSNAARLARRKAETAAGVKAGGAPGMNQARQLASNAAGGPAGQKLNLMQNMLKHAGFPSLGGFGKKAGGAAQGVQQAAQSVKKVVKIMRIVTMVFSAITSLGLPGLLVVLIIILIFAAANAWESLSSYFHWWS